MLSEENIEMPEVLVQPMIKVKNVVQIKLVPKACVNKGGGGVGNEVLFINIPTMDGALWENF